MSETQHILPDVRKALKSTHIHSTKDGVWINSRVKGSAMWGLHNAEQKFIDSFAESAKLMEQALLRIDQLELILDGIIFHSPAVWDYEPCQQAAYDRGCEETMQAVKSILCKEINQ